MAAKTADEKRAEVVAADTEATLDKLEQFTAEPLTRRIGCRVDDVELVRLTERGVLIEVAKYVYGVKDPASFRLWVAAKIDQRERHREPPPTRVADPDPDQVLVQALAKVILDQLRAIPDDQREALLRAAVTLVTSPPEPEPGRGPDVGVPVAERRPS